MFGNFFASWTNRSQGAVELTVSTVNVIDHIGAAIHSLQIERGLTAHLLSGKASGMLLKNQRQITSGLISRVKESADLAEIKLKPTLIKSINTLEDFYAKIDGLAGVSRQAFAKYTDIISEFILIIKEDIGQNIDAPVVRKAVEAHVFLVQGKEEYGRERGFVVGLLISNRPIDEESFTFLMTIIKSQEHYLDDLFIKNGDPILVNMYSNVLLTPNFKETMEMRASIIAEKDKGNFTVSSQLYFAKKTETINALRSIENASIDYLLKIVQ